MAKQIQIKTELGHGCSETLSLSTQWLYELLFKWHVWSNTCGCVCVSVKLRKGLNLRWQTQLQVGVQKISMSKIF